VKLLLKVWKWVTNNLNYKLFAAGLALFWGFFIHTTYFNNVRFSFIPKNITVISHEDNSQSILATYTFENKGNRDLDIRLKNNPCMKEKQYCKTYKIDNSYKGINLSNKTASNIDLKGHSSMRVRGGVVHEISCVHEVEEPGFYLSRLKLDVSYEKYNYAIPLFTQGYNEAKIFVKGIFTKNFCGELYAMPLEASQYIQVSKAKSNENQILQSSFQSIK